MNIDHWSIGLVFVCALWAIVGFCGGLIVGWEWSLYKMSIKQGQIRDVAVEMYELLKHRGMFSTNHQTRVEKALFH